MSDIFTNCGLHYLSSKEFEKEIAAIKLRYAAVNYDIETVKVMLPNVDIKNENISNALGWVAYKGKADIVDILLEHGADANNKEAIRDAVIYCRSTSVKSFLRHGIKKELLDGLLEKAAVRRAGMTKALLEYGVGNREEKNKALAAAVYFGKYESAKLLLEHGADADTFRNLPARLAALRNDKPMLKLLNNHGARPLEADTVYEITDAELVYMGIDISYKDMDGIYPFESEPAWYFPSEVKDASPKPVGSIDYILSANYTEKEVFTDNERFKSAFREAIDTYGVNNVRAEILSDSPELKQFVNETVIGEFGLESDELTQLDKPDIVYTEQTLIKAAAKEDTPPLKAPPKRSIREMLKAMKVKCDRINAGRQVPEKNDRDISR